MLFKRLANINTKRPMTRLVTGLFCASFYIGLSTALLATRVNAELTINITKAYDRATAIAVVPFANNNNFAMTIQNDLLRSGKFSNASSLPQQITSSQSINYNLWQSANIPYIVLGKIIPVGDAFEVQFEVLDSKSEQRLLGEKMIVPANRMREAAHVISDKIFKALTGIDGDFSGRIAYILRSRKNGILNYDLQVADTDGERPNTVFSSIEPILSPAWTPDGKQLAYVSYETGRPMIFLQDLATGMRQTLAQFKGINGAPSFSPDGQSMLFTSSKDGNAEIYQMDLSSKTLRRLTNNYAIDTEARYAADGKSFIFTSDIGGSPQLYRYFFNDASVKRLSFAGTFNGRAEFSPDGKLLAFVHRTKGQQFQISTLDIHHGIISVLSPSKLDDSPAFSPNGQMLVYATKNNQGKGVLAIVSVDGNFRMELPSQNGEISDPSWAPKP